MIHDGLVVLIHYGLYLIPGLLLCGLWFYLVPKNQPALRIAILLLTFVLLRDAMTPLGLWSLSGDLQIGCIANPFVLAMLGGLSLGLVALLARLAPPLWQLLVVFKGNRIVGLTVGVAAGCLIGLPLRLYQASNPLRLPVTGAGCLGCWCWLMGPMRWRRCCFAGSSRVSWNSRSRRCERR